MRLGRALIVVVSSVMILLLGGGQVFADTESDGFQAWSSTRLQEGSFDGTTLGKRDRPAVVIDRDRQSGTWQSPIMPLPRSIDTINPSWMADTPAGSHISVQLKVRKDNQWSDWLKLGEWASTDTNSFRRTSVNDQPAQYGTVSTDTYINTTGGKVDAYQLRVVLERGESRRSPKLFQVAAQVANPAEFTSVSQTTMSRTIDLPVPPLSQYAHVGEYPAYGGGGEAWCSPTSVAMVLNYWGTGPTRRDIASLPPDPVFDAHGRIDGEVAHAALHTYDVAYEGTGNWPFNTAYAATYGLNTSVRVFPSLRGVEQWITRKVPVVVSIAWNNEDERADNDLPGASIAKTSGHLMVVRGFTAEGEVIANDPATHGGNADVPRIYPRLQFERQFLNSSGGTGYVIAPRS